MGERERGSARKLKADWEIEMRVQRKKEREIVRETLGGRKERNVTTKKERERERESEKQRESEFKRR